jgi:hypothetical protein
MIKRIDEKGERNYLMVSGGTHIVFEVGEKRQRGNGYENYEGGELSGSQHFECL